jgi:hypothetical protein
MRVLQDKQPDNPINLKNCSANVLGEYSTFHYHLPGMKKLFPCLILFLILLNACEEDVDVTAPYKDITVVYGLLDRNDSIHYIRIQKAFLGEGNALVFAGIADSSYYPPTLDAYILEYNSSGTKVDSFHLERTVNEFPKDSGLFASSNNILYKGIKILDPLNNYKLIIIKPDGDSTIGSTHLCTPIVMGPPPLFVNFEGVAGPSGEPEQTFSWASDPGAFFYQLSMYFNYEEWVGNDSLNTTNKQAVRHFSVFKPTPQTQCATNEECFSVTKTHFYSILLWNIPVDPASTPASQVRHRRSLSVDVKISVGAQELYNYIKFNAPSLSYVQKVNTYTNLLNGAGIFSSRTAGGYVNMTIHNMLKDSIINGHKTQQLNFQY